MPAIVVHLTLYIFSNKVEDFFKSLEPVHSEATKQPEFLSFQISQGAQEDGVTPLRITEVWDGTLEWFMTTIVTKPTVVEYIKKTEPLFAKPREILIGDYLPEWTFSKKP